MNAAEMAQLLGTISLIDARVSRRDNQEKELMARAWLAIVGEHVPYEFAAKCAQDHYRNSTEVFMPVHIVATWGKEFKRLQLEENTRLASLEIESARAQRVPMPDYIKEQLEEMYKIPDEPSKELAPEILGELARKQKASMEWLKANG